MLSTDLPLIRTLSAPTLHPDGSRAVVAVTRPDLDADAYVGQLWTVPLTSGEAPRRLTRGFRDTAPRFSPDGSLLAFLRAHAGEAPQLYVVAADGGEPVQVTDRKLGVTGFRWSPDGSHLAFTSREPEQGRYGSVEGLGAGAEPPRRITTWKYAQNGLGYHLDRPQHVFLVDVPDVEAEPVVQPAPGVDGPADPRPVVAEPVRLTDVPTDHGPIAFAPDGSLAVVTTVHPGHDDDLRHDVVLLTWDFGAAEANGETELKVDAAELVGPDANLGVSAVEFAADGTLYLLGQDFGVGGRDFVARNTALYAVEGDGVGATVRRLTDPEGLDLDGPLMATPDGVLAVALVRGTQQLVRVEPDGAVVELTSGDVVVTGFGVSTRSTADATVVVSYGDPGSYGDLAVVTGGGLSRRTDFSAELRAAGVTTPTELTVRGRDGYPVHGWVAVPEGDGPHPTILMIHGGPFAAYGVGLFDETQVLTAAGYAVVYCNPRGSASYGQAHGRAIRQAMGTVDLHDVLDFLDGALASDARLDAARVGVMGGSYGGYLTAWTIAHDHRFAGAIVERGFLDPDAFFGTSDIGSFFGSEYVGTDAAAVAAQSPQAVAGQVTTPTLVLHSEQDLRCPLSQAERYFATLKRGGVEVELVVFPGEDHELSRSGRPRHRLQRFDVVLDWWQRKLPVAR